MAIITVANLKTHLGNAESVDDTVLGYAVNAANAAVPHYCGRSFDKVNSGSESARTYRLSPVGYGVRDYGTVFVHDFWETTNLVVKTDADSDGTFETTWAASDYELEPYDGIVNDQTGFPYTTIRAVGNQVFPWYQVYPRSRACVQVTAAWGWTAVPAPVFEATLIKAARIFDRRSSASGVLGGFQDFTAVRVSAREDPDVCMLLDPYVSSHSAAFVA